LTKTSSYLIAAVAVAVLAGAGAYFWLHQPAAPVPPDASPPVAEATPEPAEPASAAASEPGIKFPVQVAPADPEAAKPPSLDAALADLVGRQALLTMLQTQDFPRRFVATVDNLGRSHAPTALWPVNPMPGRLLIDTGAGTEAIGADNSSRYTPFVLLMESVDLTKAVAFYAHIYPQLQQAYEDIGFPKRYFNDRLVAVIDQLLATPDVAGPIKIHLPQINGPVKPERPWVLYEFDDPALQSLSSGQRILLRTGPDNERRLKIRLAEIRRLVAGGARP
jgi:hypothetical protein